MSNRAQTSLWTTTEWREEALAWAQSCLAAAGRAITGEVDDPRVRPWSAVVRIPTDGGVVWFKANGPGTAYEPRLVDALRRWNVPHVMAPLALDVDRAWSLFPDAGTSLRTLPASNAEITSRWAEILPEYASLQRALGERVPELLALGVPDLRPETMPRHYATLLAGTGWLRLGAQDGLSYDELRRLEQLTPQIERAAEFLASVGIASTLQHDDFHDGNVFVDMTEDGVTYYFLDWGDACVGHPFASLLATLRAVASRLEANGESDPAALSKLRDAYLEPWTDRHSRSELLEAVRCATQLGKIGRAMAWQRALAGATAVERATYAEFVPGWLRDLLHEATAS